MRTVWLPHTNERSYSTFPSSQRGVKMYVFSESWRYYSPHIFRHGVSTYCTDTSNKISILLATIKRGKTDRLQVFLSPRRARTLALKRVCLCLDVHRRNHVEITNTLSDSFLPVFLLECRSPRSTRLLSGAGPSPTHRNGFFGWWVNFIVLTKKLAISEEIDWQQSDPLISLSVRSIVHIQSINR